MVIASTVPVLKETVQNSVRVSIIDDEHPWAAIIGTYSITGTSGFDGTDVSIPAVVTASDDDVNVLNLNFGYGTLATMSIEEVEGEIMISIKDNQYIGPTPKPTDNWNRYFRATHVDGEDLYTLNALTGIFEDGVITCEYGLGFQLSILQQEHPADISHYLKTELYLLKQNSGFCLINKFICNKVTFRVALFA